MIVTRADRKKANSGETMESNIDTQANPLRLESESNGQGEASVAARGEQWYALQVRPRFEKIVATHLQHKGYTEYLPLYKSRRKWSDRMKELELPLFSGYTFCKFDAQNRLPVLIVPGVLAIVGVGKLPI